MRHRGASSERTRSDIDRHFKWVEQHRVAHVEASDILVEDLKDESLEVAGMTRPGWLAFEAMSSGD